jgi:hypothetical protein
MISFGQGSTIGFSHKGDEIIDLETYNFKTLFYRKNTRERFEITKAEMQNVGINEFYGEIPASLTAIMPSGIYTQEILLGDDFKSVAKSEAFTLFETQIR